MTRTHHILAASLLALSGASLSTGCGSNTARAEDPSDVDSCLAEREEVAAHLETFDALDFEVFSNQRWEDLHQSHADNVKVHWPDGHTTEGIDVHIADLKALFTWAPDTRIEVHPVKVGQAEWTAVVGYMEGTFTKPMTLADGTVIQPTGKAYKIRMATFSHWTEQGNFDEEFLFWDNQDFYRQLGLAE